MNVADPCAQDPGSNVAFTSLMSELALWAGTCQLTLQLVPLSKRSERHKAADCVFGVACREAKGKPSRMGRYQTQTNAKTQTALEKREERSTMPAGFCVFCA
jgi:hypothetical protein